MLATTLYFALILLVQSNADHDKQRLQEFGSRDSENVVKALMERRHGSRSSCLKARQELSALCPNRVSEVRMKLATAIANCHLEQSGQKTFQWHPERKLKDADNDFFLIVLQFVPFLDDICDKSGHARALSYMQSHLNGEADLVDSIGALGDITRKMVNASKDTAAFISSYRNVTENIRGHTSELLNASATIKNFTVEFAKDQESLLSQQADMMSTFHTFEVSLISSIEGLGMQVNLVLDKLQQLESVPATVNLNSKEMARIGMEVREQRMLIPLLEDISSQTKLYKPVDLVMEKLIVQDEMLRKLEDNVSSIMAHMKEFMSEKPGAPHSGDSQSSARSEKCTMYYSNFLNLRYLWHRNSDTVLSSSDGPTSERGAMHKFILAMISTLRRNLMKIRDLLLAPLTFIDRMKELENNKLVGSYAKSITPVLEFCMILLTVYLTYKAALATTATLDVMVRLGTTLFPLARVLVTVKDVGIQCMKRIAPSETSKPLKQELGTWQRKFERRITATIRETLRTPELHSFISKTTAGEQYDCDISVVGSRLRNLETQLVHLSSDVRRIHDSIGAVHGQLKELLSCNKGDKLMTHEEK